MSRASGSFSAEEVAVLSAILTSILRGGRPEEMRLMARTPAFRSLAQKVTRMQLRVVETPKA